MCVYVANPPPGPGLSNTLSKFKMNPKTYSTRHMHYTYPLPPFPPLLSGGNDLSPLTFDPWTNTKGIGGWGVDVEEKCSKICKKSIQKHTYLLTPATPIPPHPSSQVGGGGVLEGRIGVKEKCSKICKKKASKNIPISYPLSPKI